MKSIWVSSHSIIYKTRSKTTPGLCDSILCTLNITQCPKTMTVAKPVNKGNENLIKTHSWFPLMNVLEALPWSILHHLHHTNRWAERSTLLSWKQGAWSPFLPLLRQSAAGYTLREREKGAVCVWMRGQAALTHAVPQNKETLISPLFLCSDFLLSLQVFGSTQQKSAKPESLLLS